VTRRTPCFGTKTFIKERNGGEEKPFNEKKKVDTRADKPARTSPNTKIGVPILDKKTRAGQGKLKGGAIGLRVEAVYGGRWGLSRIWNIQRRGEG